MANINSIMDMWKSSATVSNITGQSRLYHIFDALRQYACFGVNIRQYTKRTYRMRNFELRQTITDNQWGKIRRKFNNQKYEYLFENKVEFNRKFAQFIKRDWIASKDGNTIRDFIAKHGKVIVKPIKEMQGMGIHITNHYDEKYSATEYLFEEIIQQHPDMMLNNKALNTIRVYSVLSSNNNKKDSVKIVKTCLRGGGRKRCG